MSASFVSTSVLAVAQRLADQGYWLVPTINGTKAATDRNWTDLRITPDQVPERFRDEIDPGVGILLGIPTAKDASFVIGIDVDVDDPLLIERIGLAFDFVPPAKKGAKGITYFCRTAAPLKKRYFKRKDPITNASSNCVEVLATGQQTVIPPSLHPSGINYQWVGRPLYDYAPGDLPVLTAQIMQEIELAVKQPDSPVFGLNTMESADGRGGGTIHMSTLAATASLVAYGWDDDDIWARVNRATIRAVGANNPNYKPEDRETLVRNMCIDARKKGFDASGKKKEKISVVAARWLISEWIGEKRVYNRDGRICAYRGGWYETMAPDIMRYLLANTYPKPDNVSLDHNDFVNILNTALDMAPPFPVSIPHRKVCLTNGTLDLETSKLAPWSHEDFLISQLPFAFDEKATCPIYEDFVKQTFWQEEYPDDLERQINTFEEYVAHTLFECLDYHKFLVIKGKPRTGKSTLINVARMLHSASAVSSVGVQDFANERYRTAMVGKLLNVVTEVAAMSHAADDFLKAVTAGDPVQVRYLYEEPRMVQLPSRILIACNEMFRTRDTSGAIEARMMILTCDNVVPPKERDIKLTRKLQAEMPGIFNRMIKAWERLAQRGHFDPPRSQYAQLDRFTEENNHVLQWYKTRTHQGAKLIDPEYEVPDGMKLIDNESLYMDYAEWSRLNGFKQMSSISFGMKLSEIGVKSEPIKLGGRTIRVRPVNLINAGNF